MDEKLVNVVARAMLSEYANLYGDHSGRWENAGEMCQEEFLAYARAALAAVNASGTHWVAPRVPTAKMMLPFEHGMGEQWSDYTRMRDTYLAEQEGTEP